MTLVIFDEMTPIINEKRFVIGWKPTGRFRLCIREWDGIDKPDYTHIETLTFDQAKSMVEKGIASDYTRNDVLSKGKPRYRVKAKTKKIPLDFQI